MVGHRQHARAQRGKPPLVRDLLLGEEGVMRKWLRDGAMRLEAGCARTGSSDDLIRNIKTALLEEATDCSSARYGGRLQQGETTASSAPTCRAMSFDSRHELPRSAIWSSTSWLRTMNPRTSAAERIENRCARTIRARRSWCALNLLGSHDKPRIASRAGRRPRRVPAARIRAGAVQARRELDGTAQRAASG